jgi:hypothetical protein
MGADSAARLRRLAALRLCEVTSEGVLVRTAGEPWFEQAARRNVDHLFQLLAGLAEVGALAEFAAGAEEPPELKAGSIP